MSSSQPLDTTSESSPESVEAGPLARAPGYRHPQNRNGIDWIGRDQQGGGRVPEDFTWNSNPKQDQEDGSAP